jgi:hypothetical protein
VGGGLVNTLCGRRLAKSSWPESNKGYYRFHDKGDRRGAVLNTVGVLEEDATALIETFRKEYYG